MYESFRYFQVIYYLLLSTKYSKSFITSFQITGQPNILYYAPTVFQQLGYRSSSAATLAAVGLGLVKVLFFTVAESYLVFILVIDCIWLI